MNATRMFAVALAGVVLAVASATGASALEAGQYLLNPCTDPPGASFRSGWTRAGNGVWSLEADGCETWLQQAPTNAYSLYGSATATLALGPGDVESVRLDLGGSDGSDRFVSQQVMFCGQSCGQPISVDGTAPPGGIPMMFEAGQAELPADTDRVVMSATCLQVTCATGAPLKVLGMTAQLSDPTPPVVSIPAPPNWLNADSSIAFSAEDPESGIDYVRLSRFSGSQATPLCGSVVTEQPNSDNAWPCPLALYGAELPLPTGLLSQGSNALSFAVHNGADVATTRVVTLRYDSTAPSAPTSIDYGQSERGWAVGTNLTLRWTNAGENKESSTQSGVVAARLVIDPLDPWNETKTFSATGEGVAAIPFSLDGYGTHEAHLTLTDGAGNVRTKDFEIRNDNGEVAPPSGGSFPPVNVASETNGAKFTWSAAEPLSKLCGFRVEFNADPDTDFGGPDPNRPVTATTASWVLTPSRISQLSDGQHYLHVQSVACSDAVSPVRHFPVLIDRSPPQVEVIPAPKNGWLTNGGSVTLRTTDPGSSRPPILSYQVGSVRHVSYSEDTAVAVPKDGARLSWSAVDGAGNELAEQSITVGIDSAPPIISIARPSNDDPTAIQVAVLDADSGVVDARLDLVSLANGSRVQLVRSDSGAGPALGAMNLAARVPDDGSLADGIYGLEVTARDASGRESTQSSYTDGAAAELPMPLRPASALTAGTTAPNGGASPAKRVLKYGARSRLTGVLRDSHGAPVAGAELSVVAEHEDGGRFSLGVVATRADGSYGLALQSGTSRTIRVRFAGNSRMRPASAVAVQRFRAGVTLAVRRAKGGLILRGKVRAFSAASPSIRALKVEFELCPRGRCTQFGAWTRTDSDGGFSKFWPTRKLSNRSKYRFRARVDAVPGWPFADGVSKIVKFRGGSK